MPNGEGGEVRKAAPPHGQADEGEEGLEGVGGDSRGVVEGDDALGITKRHLQ